ncbi:hypothetical protein [Larkinella harenae]
MLHVNLVYNTNQPYHKDLSLVFDDLINDTQDSYFYALDNFILPKEETWAKVIVVLNNVLIKWNNIVSNLSENEVSYLPFDFSDQYIGCMRVAQITQKNIKIQYGYQLLLTALHYALLKLNCLKLSQKSLKLHLAFRILY